MKLIVQYLDDMIVHHRDSYKRAEKRNDNTGMLMAQCYIDALQSVRIRHGLPVLPLHEINAVGGNNKGQ